MTRLTNVSCYYTGGSIYVYEAKFNDEVWISTDFDLTGSYDIPWHEIDNGDQKYDDHWKTASIPYPTWAEVFQSIRENCDESTIHDVGRILEYYCANGQKMTDRILDAESNAPMPSPDENAERLAIICEFIEAFEDFLDEKGVVIPNDEKEQDPESACNIYGTDYGSLSDRIESLLIRYGVLK